MKTFRHRLLPYLRELARDGEVCPTNRQIAAHFAVGMECVRDAFDQLRELHRISIERAGNRRIVTILGDGLTTADPRPAPEPIPARPRVRELIEAASLVFDVPVCEIASASRTRRHARPRQAVYYAAYQHGWTSGQIGRVLGRDHSTVRIGRKRAASLQAGDPAYAAKIAELLKRAPASRGGA